MWDKIPGPLCTARDRKVGRGLGMRQRHIITSSASCDWLFMSIWSQPPGVSGDWSEGIWRCSVWDQPGLLSQQRWDQDTNVHHPQEGKMERKERLPHLVWNQSTPLTNNSYISQTEQHEPKGWMLFFIRGMQLIYWMLCNPSNPLPHPLPSPPILLKFKYLVAKQHPKAFMHLSRTLLCWCSMQWEDKALSDISTSQF